MLIILPSTTNKPLSWFSKPLLLGFKGFKGVCLHSVNISKLFCWHRQRGWTVKNLLSDLILLFLYSLVNSRLSSTHKHCADTSPQTQAPRALIWQTCPNLSTLWRLKHTWDQNKNTQFSLCITIRPCFRSQFTPRIVGIEDNDVIH